MINIARIKLKMKNKIKFVAKAKLKTKNNENKMKNHRESQQEESRKYPKHIDVGNTESIKKCKWECSIFQKEKKWQS